MNATVTKNRIGLLEVDKVSTTAFAIITLLSADASAAFRADVVAANPKDASDYSWGFQLSGGMLNGEANENIFWYDAARNRAPLSELDWDLENVYMVGGNGSLRMQRLSVNLGAWVAVSEGDGGHMQDYDWMQFGDAQWTHFSDSRSDVAGGWILDLNAGWDFVQDPEGLTLRGLLGYKMNVWEWEAYGGYALYPEYGYAPHQFDEKAIGIKYEQDLYIPYVGLDLDWFIWHMNLSAYVLYSPLVYADGYDQHLERGTELNATFSQGDMLGAGLAAKYTFGSGVFISAAVDYQSIDRIIGDLTLVEKSTGKTWAYPDFAGIENSYTAFSLGLGMVF